jgi:hypothetical protein
MTKDDRAKALIEAEIRQGWPDIVQSVSVTPHIDFLDEPALGILVELKSIEQTPASWPLGSMLARLRSALTESGDTRNPRISFSAPDKVFDGEVDDEEWEETQGADH